MKLEPLGSLYHALYILQKPLARHVENRLKKRPKWFEEVKGAMPAKNHFYRRDDIIMSIRAIDLFWDDFERMFAQNQITRSNLQKLQVIRNKVAHISEDELTHGERQWAFEFIHRLLNAMSEKEAAEDVAFLFKGFKKGAYITGRQGIHCRVCGRKLDSHKRPCAPRYESHRNEEKVGKYCAFCGQECKIEEDIVYSATCANPVCIVHPSS